MWLILEHKEFGYKALNLNHYTEIRTGPDGLVLTYKDGVDRPLQVGRDPAKEIARAISVALQSGLHCAHVQIEDKFDGSMST